MSDQNPAANPFVKGTVIPPEQTSADPTPKPSLIDRTKIKFNHHKPTLIRGVKFVTVVAISAAIGRAASPREVYHVYTDGNDVAYDVAPAAVEIDTPVPTES